FGHHALPRYFHGKAPFLVVMVPLIAVLTTAALRNDDRRALLFLAGSMVVAIGMTANALYAAPLTAALVGLAFFFTKRGERWRTLRLPFAVIYPFALAAYLILFAPPGGSEREDTTTIGGTLWSVFGAPGIMVLGLSAIFFAAVLPLLNKRFTGLAFYVVAAFVFVLNPLLWPVYEDYVTGNINYRLFWTVPLPFLFAVGLGIIWRASNRVFRVALLIGLAILVLGPGSILWRADPGLHVRKVPSERFETATGLVDLLDKPSLLLAPEEISAWVPVLESAPYLVEAQRIYNPQREDERYTDILERRGSLFSRWSDKEVADFDPDDLATDLADLGVDAVLVDSNRAHHRASIESLEARGWSEAWRRGSYRLLTR
ncbi:MAG: hypothetical protein V2I43_25695, partial [Parvularcula sp.]|nr:hypothetical protein [Parvularcula sp.]